MDKRTAIVIGATGMTGSRLVYQLLKDDRFALVRTFVRRPSGVTHPKLEEHLINFDNYQEWKYLVTGDVLFSALGTTLKQAGSKENQYKIDYTYQYQFATAAAENKVPVLVLVSSASANPDSPFFYMKMKGELERDVKKLSFDSIQILQPGPLVGERKDERTGEKIGIGVMNFLNGLGIAKKMKPISGELLAQAMINVSFKTNERERTYALLEVFEQAKSS